VTARAAAAQLGEQLRAVSRSPAYARAVAWLPVAPLLAIAAYAVVLATHVPSFVRDTATSDSTGTMVIAESLPSAPAGSTVVMGNAPHYTTLWFDEVTRNLPGHRAIWQAMPYVLFLIGLAVLVATVRRLAGARAALVAGAIGIALPPLLLLPEISQGYHGSTVFNGIVLAALLVWLARTPRITAMHVLAGAEAIAVLTGLDIASDPLLLLTGVAPFAAAVALLAWQRRDRRGGELLLVAGGVVLVALLAAGLTSAAMHRAGYSVVGGSGGSASLARMRSNASLLGQLVLDMANGRFGVSGLGSLGPLRILLGLIAIAGALVPLWLLQYVARGASDMRAVAADDDPSDARHRDAVTMFVSFWGFTALFLLIFFVLATVPTDRSAARYLVPAFLAIAATVPFLTLRGRGTAATVALAVTLSGMVGAVLLPRATIADFAEGKQDSAGLVAVLEAHGLHHGYAGYWQANVLTWKSDGRIVSRAVQQSAACSPNAPGWFCPYQQFTVSDWYVPQPGPSFLVRELGGAFVPAAPPPDVRPTSVFSFYPFEIYVYDHDIGSDAALHTTGWSG